MARYFFGDPGYGWNAMFRSDSGVVPAGCERITRAEAEQSAKKFSDYNGYIYPYPIPERYIVPDDVQTFYDILSDAKFGRNGTWLVGRIIICERYFELQSDLIAL